MNREELQRRLINNNNNVDANSNISVSSSQQVINAQPLENNIMSVPRQFPSSEGVPSSSSSYSNSASGASSSTAVSNNSVPASEDELIRNIVPLHEDEYAMILQSYCDSQGITIEEYFNGANGNTNDRDPNRLGPVVLEDDGLDENLLRNRNLDDPVRDPQITVNLLRNSIQVGQRLAAAITASEESQAPEATHEAVQRATESIAHYVNNTTRGGAGVNLALMGTGVLLGGLLMYFVGNVNLNRVPEVPSVPVPQPDPGYGSVAGFNFFEQYFFGFAKKK